MTAGNQEYKASTSQLFLALLLTISHLLAGFSILIVSSWFIAACSIAGLGFNYMLPAVVIRALALIRIASGYFSLLVGHSDLLGRLAALRLTIFVGLQNKVAVSREESLDALNHQSEEVAAIWMSWVGQNAGALLSLLALNAVCILLLPELISLMLLFTLCFVLVYAVLLASMLHKSHELVVARKKMQFDIVQHIEAAPLWHLYENYDAQAPAMRSLHELIDALQRRVRTAVLALFLVAMTAITAILSTYSDALVGNALFIILPVALLSMNDWLAPTLGNQRQLLNYLVARKSINEVGVMVEGLEPKHIAIQGFKLLGFKASSTHMPSVDAELEQNTLTVVLGSSGVGKSRFLQALGGLIAFEGCREVLVKSEVGEGNDFKGQALLRDCFYLEQFPYVLSDSLAENLRVANRGASDTELLGTLKKVGLGYLTNLEQWLGEHGLPLSGGEKKRLGLARAMLSKSSVVLLDEPFESLDDANIQRVTAIINTLSHRKMVVISTHILPATLKYHQRVVLEASSRKEGRDALERLGP